ncbi:MAG TPA: quinoprotein dehydrogenase-associated SoxYZ-like carrier [Gaiellales bacterium]|nr:quinoprotein dehydrogenase-associated SoxYZ-like carrier [Gaiellales bacterium]
MSTRHQLFGAALLGLFGLAGTAEAQIKSGDDPEASVIWHKVRASLFAERPIRADAGGLIELQAPVRAEDAAVVPMAIKTRLVQTPQRYIGAVYLIIDNNPSPIAAIFRFTPQSGRADIETRVRIDEYTFVRAIAEMNDGQLYMTAKWVKASGGCSAPAGKDQVEALKTLGKMKFRVDGDMSIDKPVLAQLMISHPNNSGLAMDQSTRQYTPAHFVRKIDVSYRGRPVMSADLDISISENPNFRFYFVPGGQGELKADVVDSEGLHFESALKLQVPG